jgi:hypothetical protein
MCGQHAAAHIRRAGEGTQNNGTRTMAEVLDISISIAVGNNIGTKKLHVGDWIRLD